MTLHIGVASYQKPDDLAATLRCIQTHTSGDWVCMVHDNASPDPRVRSVIEEFCQDPRFVSYFSEENVGYVGAVNRLLAWAALEGGQHLAYVDNDCFIHTPAWNERMLEPLERHHEVAASFPRQFSFYPIKRSGYSEVLWGLGCFWILSLARYLEVGPWDESLGHQEEADYCQRLRMAGWKLAAVDGLDVHHKGNASNDPAALERINAGVVRWVNKWAAYYGGKNINYHSPNVVRFADWTVNALYLEEFYQQAQREGGLPMLNQNVRQVTLDGQTYDVCEVLRHPHLYRDRLI